MNKRREEWRKSKKWKVEEMKEWRFGDIQECRNLGMEDWKDQKEV